MVNKSLKSLNNLLKDHLILNCGGKHCGLIVLKARLGSSLQEKDPNFVHVAKYAQNSKKF